MVGANELDGAQVVLLATRLATESDLVQLQQLAAERKQVLIPSLLYSILLTYLPTEADNIASLAKFLAHLQNDFRDVSSLDLALDESLLQEHLIVNAGQKLHELRLVRVESSESADYDDELSDFIVLWLQKVETVSGLPVTAVNLLEPFIASRPQLLHWQDSYLVPLIKLQNEFYPDRTENLSTQALENLHGQLGVKLLLHFAEQDGDEAHIGRDLEEVVSPWVRGAGRVKRRRLSGPDEGSYKTTWRDVNEWMYATSRTNLKLAAKSFLDWSGPRGDSTRSQDTSDNELSTSYAQTGLAMVVSSSGTGNNVNTLLDQILNRAATITSSVTSDSAAPLKRDLSSISRADLLENSLLLESNPITRPSEGAFAFLQHCLLAQRLLDNLKLPLSVSTIVETSLLSSEDRQKQELQHILSQVPRMTRTEIEWPLLRRHLQLLRTEEPSADASGSKQSAYHYLGRVPNDFLEQQFLNALLAANQYSIIKNIYLDSPDELLPKDMVKNHVVAAIYDSYDNSSNGNRTRGGIKRANDVLKAFQSNFPSEAVFSQVDHLIRATHSLSFYQLTLQHGVPFQPVNIRIHHDPVSLLEKVLAQNNKAYTKLDDLIEIGRNLVQAGLQNSADPEYASKSVEERLFDVEHRVTYLAIASALSEHDFDTAYSYITTRLATSPSQVSTSPFMDDTSWRAAYAAGKHRPSSSPKNLHERITGLSKRMDLLSLALTLTPTPEPLSEILATWRRCEEEVESLKSQAVEEERVIDSVSRGNEILPGGFSNDTELDAAETRRLMERRALRGTGPGYEEEAPMGLFDVARGAASAFRKSAFPLRSASGQSSAGDRATRGEDLARSSIDESRSSGEYQRVRKRDVVSNMVTGGLVSGMSWVLGAPPSGGPSDERP